MKIGFSQIGVPAPLLIRRAVNGIIAIIQPATTTLIIALPEDWVTKDARVFLLALSSYVGTFFKWLEYVLGTNPEDIQAVKEGDPK